MRFLKKASIEDLLLSADQENELGTGIDIMSHYKEFELYLSHMLLEKRCGEEYYKENQTIHEVAGPLQKVLKKNNAVISAIYVPESLFKTSGESDPSKCKAIRNSNSYQFLEFCIRLADEINFRQYDDGEGKKNPIILIVHAGCIKSCIKECQPEEDSCSLKEDGDEGETRRTEKFAEKLNAINIKTKVKIAVKNIAPYDDESNGDADKKAGENCGWKVGEEQKRICRLLKKINDKIVSKEKTEKNSSGKEEHSVSFGLCVDFCHIFASHILKNTASGNGKIESGGNEALCNAMDAYFKDVHGTKPLADIYLFHVSQYGEKGEHGALFQYKTDARLVEKIQQLCRQSAPQAPITLEMMDGDDREKACKYFDDMVYSFSAMHKMGAFAELLAAEKNKELREFFDDLFWIYTSDGKDSFKLSEKAWHVKAYILQNSHHKPDEDKTHEDTPFGFTADGTTENTALFRLKAYIYYTRFCNLGVFLAENYYKSFPFSGREDDFRLAMNYFMLNDKMEQCVYTGVAYKFNIDFLPRKESFYRFNDDIHDISVKKMAVRTDGKVFSHIAKMILDQINGSELKLYSVGKNFGQCLFKYYNPQCTGWSFRIYKDVPVNYIECDGRRYSIPAFLQIQETLGLNGKSIGFAIDVSRFRKGRDGNGTSSLEGFFKDINDGWGIENKQENSVDTTGISKQKVASISDGEIVLTELPDCAKQYTINLAESMLLKKAYFDIKTYFRNSEPGASKYTFRCVINLKKAEEDRARARASQDESVCWETVMPIIEEMKEIENLNQVEGIIEHLCTDVSREESRDLSDLTPYRGNNCNVLYKAVEKYIEIKREESSDGQ